MAKKVLTNLDMNLNEIQNVKAQIVATDPTTGVAGQFIYNSTDKVFKYYNGTSWAAIGEGVQTVSAKTGEYIIAVDNTDPKNPNLAFNISTTQGESVEVKQNTDGLMVEILDSSTTQKGIVQLDSTRSATEETKAITPKGANVTLTEQATAETGYLKTYVLNQGGSEVGKINIPKDFLVKSATTGIVTTADKAAGGKFSDETKYSEFLVGDSYIDLVINVKEGTATDEHLYILCKKLGRFVYEKMDLLEAGDTALSITIPKQSDFVNAYVKDLDDNILVCDVSVIKPTATYDGTVTFRIASAYPDNLFCVVVYNA